MADDSYLDDRYFIDRHVYNCPFCNRRHVLYSVIMNWNFDWTDNKKCYIYLVECHSCEKRSMHLSYTDIEINIYRTVGNRNYYRFNEEFEKVEDPDELFFYSVPTSFFIQDQRIPRILRELMTEAEGCLKGNFLTGASACTRKIVYELGIIQKAEGANYEERIKSLKTINSSLDPTYFDTLLTIQQVTSDKVHEESYDGWQSKHIRLILSSLNEILHEIFVAPAILEEKRANIIKMKETILGSKK